MNTEVFVGNERNERKGECDDLFHSILFHDWIDSVFGNGGIVFILGKQKKERGNMVLAIAFTKRSRNHLVLVNDSIGSCKYKHY